VPPSIEHVRLLFGLPGPLETAMISYKNVFQSSKQIIALPYSSQPAFLHLGQGPASTEESHESHDSSGRQGLKKVPASVVHEEDAFHCQYRAIEERMRDGRITQSLVQVASVCAQSCPNTEQYRQRGSNSCGKDDCYDLRRRFGIRFEDVVNLGLGRVSKGRLGDGEGDVGVAGHLQVEDLALVRRRRAKGSNNKRSFDWLRGSEELVGKIFLRLRLSVSFMLPAIE
jgi:hypothetical protein